MTDKGAHENKLPNQKVAAGREPSGFTTPDGLRRFAKSVSYFQAAPNSARLETKVVPPHSVLGWTEAISLLPLIPHSTGRE